MEAGRDGAEVAIVLEGCPRHRDGTSAQGKALGGPRDTAPCLRVLLWAQEGASGQSPRLSNQRTLAMAIPRGLSVTSFWPHLPRAYFHFLIAAERQSRGASSKGTEVNDYANKARYYKLSEPVPLLCPKKALRINTALILHLVLLHFLM